MLNQTLNTLHGIPQYADIQKRRLVDNIIASNSDFYELLLVMPNGNMYLLEPYSIQEILTKDNYAFRDYFQGAIKTNDTYLGNVHTGAAASGVRSAKIAVPVYSLKDNSTIVGVWAGSIDFNILNKELQSLNITSLSDNGNNTRVVKPLFLYFILSLVLGFLSPWYMSINITKAINKKETQKLFNFIAKTVKMSIPPI